MRRRPAARPLVGAALLLAWLAAAPAVRAETLYVIEQVVVNVNSAPDASGERIATVKSGEPLEMLERAGDQVHVRLGNGRDGWIRSGYVSADEPLRVRLAQRDADVARLRDELNRLQSQLRTVRPAAADAGVAAVPSLAPAPGVAPPAEDPANPQRALFSAAPDESPPHVWRWVLGSAFAALCIGFALGALTLDRHIRRKYGGLRIY